MLIQQIVLYKFIIIIIINNNNNNANQFVHQSINQQHYTMFLNNWTLCYFITSLLQQWWIARISPKVHQRCWTWWIWIKCLWLIKHQQVQGLGWPPKCLMKFSVLKKDFMTNCQLLSCANSKKVSALGLYPLTPWPGALSLDTAAGSGQTPIIGSRSSCGTQTLDPPMSLSTRVFFTRTIRIKRPQNIKWTNTN